jgi:hypothetical protein
MTVGSLPDRIHEICFCARGVQTPGDQHGARDKFISAGEKPTPD